MTFFLCRYENDLDVRDEAAEKEAKFSQENSDKYKKLAINYYCYFFFLLCLVDKN